MRSIGICSGWKMNCMGCVADRMARATVDRRTDNDGDHRLTDVVGRHPMVSIVVRRRMAIVVGHRRWNK